MCWRGWQKTRPMAVYPENPGQAFLANPAGEIYRIPILLSRFGKKSANWSFISKIPGGLFWQISLAGFSGYQSCWADLVKSVSWPFILLKPGRGFWANSAGGNFWDANLVCWVKFWAKYSNWSKVGEAVEPKLLKWKHKIKRSNENKTL